MYMESFCASCLYWSLGNICCSIENRSLLSRYRLHAGNVVESSHITFLFIYFACVFNKNLEAAPKLMGDTELIVLDLI